MITTTDAQQLTRHCETQIAMVELSTAFRPAELIDIRRPVSDTMGFSSRREVVVTFETEVLAQKFYSAIQKAAGRV